MYEELIGAIFDLKPRTLEALSCVDGILTLEGI